MSEKVTILVVDDVLQTMHAVSRLLEEVGYRVIGAASGGDCLRLTQEHRPALTLLKTTLPDIDGLEVCRRIKADPNLAGSFVVLLSNLKTTTEEQAQGLEEGADGYIAGPISNRELLARVEALLRIRQIEAQVQHLNAVLRAIRNVNQLIVREKDPQRLIQSACHCLIETRGYFSAWIGLVDPTGKATAVAQAGLGETFAPVAGALGRGVLPRCGQKALQQTGVLALDVASACLDCPLQEAHGPRTALATRLEHEEEVYGFLVVSLPAGISFSEQDLSLLDEVAGDLAFALHNIELEEARRQAEEALKRRLEQVTALSRASQAVTSSLELDQVLNEIVSLAGDVLDSDYTGVVLVNEAGDVDQTAESESDAPNLKYRIREDGFTSWIVASRRPIIVDEIGQDGAVDLERGAGAPRSVNPYVVETGVKSLAGLPLVAKERLLGVLYLHSMRPDAFRDQEAVLNAFANQVAAAIENAWLFGEAQQEIAARRQAEETLRAEREQLFALFDSIDQVIYVADPHSYEVLFVNQYLKNRLGHDPSGGICYREFQNLEHPCEFCTNEIILQQKGKPYVWEYHNPHMGGDYQITDKAIKWPDGRDVRFEIAIDITARKQAEEALQRQLQELTALHAVASACIEADDEDRLITQISQLICEALYPEDFGLFVLDPATGLWRPHPSYHQSADTPVEFLRPGEGIIGQAAQEGRPRRVGDVRQESDYVAASAAIRSELAVPVKIGERVIAVINAESSQPDFFTAADERLLSTVAGQLATALERIRLDRETRRQLAELEALHRASQEIMAAGTDPERVYTGVHRVVSELMPCEAFVIILHDEARGENEAVYLIDKGGRRPGRRIPADQGLSGYVISQGTTLHLSDFPHNTHVPAVRFGSPTSVRSILAVPLRVGERVIGMLSAQSYQPHAYTHQDRVLLETLANHVAAGLESIHLFQQAQEQARRVRGVVDTVPEGVFLLDAAGRVLLANPVAEGDLAVLADAGVGDTITRLGDRPLAELLTSPPRGLWHEVRAEGRIFEVIARPMDNGPEPERWVVVVNDVTREREVRAHLQQQERLATVGQLAAGMAHDFNNILAVIVLYAHMLVQAKELSDQDRERAAIIVQEAQHATRLIHQVLDFSRRAVLERQPIDMLPLLKEQVRLLKRTLPEHIQIELEYGAEEYTVHADPTRIQQVVMNLAVNARDALPGGGSLRIGLERIQVESDKTAPLPEMKPGEWIKLTVSDTGTGIPSEVLPHIYEPFFTTKGPGRGSGLGLSQVYGIVKQHDGHIDVESQVNEGTTFTIYLPALAVAAPAPLTVDVSAMPQGRGETVLLVEDGEAVRAAVRASLEQLNYRVLEAANGEEALAVMEERGDQIAVVVSDVVMPVMGGIALLHALGERGWEKPVILLTGHVMGKELEDLRVRELIACLSKPPAPEQLARAIAQALHRSFGA